MIAQVVTLSLTLAADVAAVDPAPRPPDFGAGASAALVALPSVDFTFAVPANGATIPTNAQLIAFGQFFDDVTRSDDDGGVNPEDVLFERVHDDGSRTALTAIATDGSSFSTYAFLVDLGELVLGETVTVACDACFETWSATVIDVVDETPPAFNVGNKNRIAVTDMGADVGYQVRACIPAPIDSSGGAVALRVITDVRDGYTAAIQGTGTNGGCGLDEVDVAAFADGDARLFCFQTLAVDAAGNESLFHENVCTELPAHPEGCSQAGTSSSSWLVALLLACALLGARRQIVGRALVARSDPSENDASRENGGQAPDLQSVRGVVVVQSVVVVVVVAALTFAPAAFALPAPPPSPDATSVFPPNNADLPSNARVVFFAQSVGTDVEIVRVDDTDEFPVEHEEVRVGQVAVALVVSPPLAPNTTMTLATRCDSCSFTADYQIRAEPDETPPVWSSGEAEVTLRMVRDFVGRHVAYDVLLSLPRASDESQGGVWTFARRDDDAVIEASRVHDDTAQRVELQTTVGASETRLCLDVIAVDVAGNEARFPEQVCTDLAPELAENGGCSQSGAATSLTMLSLLSLLFFIRRVPRSPASALVVVIAALCAPAARADAIFVPQDVFEAYPVTTLTLPSNGRVAMFGTNVPDISFTRTTSDGTPLTLDHDQVLSPNEGIYLVNPGELVAGEPLIVSSSCAAGCGFVAEWTVSADVDEQAPTIADGPVATEVEAVGGGFGEGVTGYDTFITLPIITDNFGPTLVVIQGEAVATHVVAGEANASTAFLFSPGADARTECYRVRAIDMAGNETVRAEDVCVDLDPSLAEGNGFSCASTSSPATWTWTSVSVLMLALLRLRRA